MAISFPFLINSKPNNADKLIDYILLPALLEKGVVYNCMSLYSNTLEITWFNDTPNFTNAVTNQTSQQTL